MKRQLQRWLWRTVPIFAVVALVLGLADVTPAAKPVCAGGGCSDSDRTAEYPDGINVWERGTVTCPGCNWPWPGSFTPGIGMDACGATYYVFEQFCSSNSVAFATLIDCRSQSPGAYCQGGRCVRAEPEPEPFPRGEPAYVSIELHGLVPIEGQCREVGLDSVGIRLTGAPRQLELRTNGMDGEASWIFWNPGDGFHTIEAWTEWAGWIPLVRLGETEPVSFKGSDLSPKEPLVITVLWWAQCQP